jgi:hypothetical protein
MPWLTVGQPDGPDCFRTNLDGALIDQFLDGVQAPVEELHVSAPFWDDELAAFPALLDEAAERARLRWEGHASRRRRALKHSRGSAANRPPVDLCACR